MMLTNGLIGRPPMTRIKLEYVHEYTRRGKPYYYFRRRGFKQVRLPGLPGSAEFMAAYEQALSQSRPKEIGANRTKPGTVNAAIVGYYQCLAFRELASGTQLTRRHIGESFASRTAIRALRLCGPNISSV